MVEGGFEYRLSREELQAEEASFRLRRQVAEQPALQQYVTDSMIRNAASVFKGARRLLAEHSFLLDQLEEAHEDAPDRVTLLLIPNKPLVVARTAQGIVAMAPVMGCTYQALNEVEDTSEPVDAYRIVSSTATERDLVAGIWERANANPDAILSYHGSGYDARDYIALGASGLLNNEVFRMNISIPGEE